MTALIRSIAMAALAGMLSGPPAAGAETRPAAPYMIGPQYRPVLHASQLQAPGSSTRIPQGAFNRASAHNRWFYIPAGGQPFMTFEVSGEGHRSELRQMREWSTADRQLHRMVGRVHLPAPTAETPDQYTFMQILDAGRLSRPLLRIVWLRQRDGIADHIWAVVRDSATRDSTATYIDLGPRGSGGRLMEVAAGANRLTIKVDGRARVSGRDIAHWADMESYFKAGVYLQRPGTARVQFETLAFSR